MANRCPSRRRLLDHFDVASDERVAGHLLGGCAACQVILEGHERTVVGLAAGPLTLPPSALLRKAGKLLGHHRRRQTLERVRGFVARLVFDERLEPVPALRSVPGGSRRMLFEVGDGELFVTLTRESRRWRLEGEMLAPVREVALLRNGAERQRVDVDDVGRFSFQDLAGGAWCLAGEADGTEFVTDSFVL